MLRCTGRVLRVESKPWTMEGRAGVTHTVRVMVGDADFQDVKYPDGPQGLPLPNKGDSIDLAVVPAAPGGRLSITARGTWADVIGLTEPAKTAPLAAARPA